LSRRAELVSELSSGHETGPQRIRDDINGSERKNDARHDAHVTPGGGSGGGGGGSKESAWSASLVALTDAVHRIFRLLA